MRPWLLVALLGACSSSKGPPDAGAADDLAVGSVADAAPPADAAMSARSHVRVHYPAGTHSLAIRGDTTPLDWNAGAPMTAAANDTFTYDIDVPMGVAQVQWKPLLDDMTWSRGPNYVVARGQTVDVYPHFIDTAGTVEQFRTAFHSTILDNDRVVWAYLPPSYSENTLATYPVLYMHDGQNLFDTQPTFGTNGWRVDHALDGAAEDGSIREIIVIAPENAGSMREYEYTPDVDPTETEKSGGGDLYLRMLVEELKPVVDGALRTQPARATTGILGSSLGGLISVYAGTTKPTTYGLVGALSPSTWWNDTVIVGDVMAMGLPHPDRVYVDCGDDDDDEEDTVNLAAAYRSVGYVDGASFEYYVQPGGQHGETWWAERFPGAAAMLFGARTP